MFPFMRGGLIELWLEGNTVHVSLSEEFMQEIQMRKAAIHDWSHHRQVEARDRKENLSEAPPRLHYYLFTERALPMIAFKDPDNFLAVLNDKTGDNTLQMVWDAIGAALDPEDRVQELEWTLTQYGPSPGIKAICLRFGKPDPESEIWMMVLIEKRGKKRLLLPPKVEHAFFTLEIGIKARDGENLIMRKWENGEPRRLKSVSVTNEQDFMRLTDDSGWE